MSNNNPSDLELLAMRAEGLVDRSLCVRFDKTTSEQDALAVSCDIPSNLADSLNAAWETLRRATPPPDPVPVLRQCQAIFAAQGVDVRTGGPSLVYVIPPGTSLCANITLQRSQERVPSWLRGANPGNWEPLEWDELLHGALGPWVMGTVGQRVVSITHAPTPLTERSVEAGAWTDPEFRGRGFAAAVTSEWARILRPSGRVLFYSTSPENRSSQRLAERLGLLLVGHQWLLHLREREGRGDVHPSSALRASAPSVRSATTASIPLIETERLHLESMSVEFLRDVLAGVLERARQRVDYEVPADFSLYRKLGAVEHRLRLIEADASQHPWMYRAIVTKESRELVGYVSFHHKAPDPDLHRYGQDGAELAYAIEPIHRRRGYAKESATGMMQWAFQQFGVRRFVLTISPDNVPSLRTAASMGFAVIGEHQDPVDGPELVMQADIDVILARQRGRLRRG